MSDRPVNYRSEALGAFAHEFRTPLTAIKMVTELGRRAGSDGSVLLDPDIAPMLEESMAGLEELADGIQALSWLERGKLNLASGPCDLALAVKAAHASLGETVMLDVCGVEGVTGGWDPDHLPKLLAAVIESAARCGNGNVSLHACPGPSTVTLTIQSGEPGGELRPINADLGFRFFAACVTLEYADATVVCERANRYLKAVIELPA